MLVAIWGVGLFLVCFLFHIIMWRVCRPKKSGRALLVLFLFTSIVFLGAWSVVASLGLLAHELGPNGVGQSLHVFLLSFALMAMYIASYPAVEADSPTLLMIRMIVEHEKKGISREQLIAAMGDDVLVVPRLHDLLTSELATYESGTYRVTPKGRGLANLFLFTRRVLKAQKGG